MLIVPGVTGGSNDPYIKVMCHRANKEGYISVVINGLITKDSTETHTRDYRVLDFSDSSVLRDSIDKIHELFGDNCEIYGVGFSLGANHLLRYLGDHPDAGVKAAISISNPFDVLSTCVKLRYKNFGLYDYSIQKMLAKPFIDKRFKHDDFGEEWDKKMKKINNLLDFDNHVRGPILGYNSGYHLHRNISW